MGYVPPPPPPSWMPAPSGPRAEAVFSLGVSGGTIIFLAMLLGWCL